MTGRPARVLAVIDLVQDLDVLAPVLLALRADPRFALRVVVSRWLAGRAPRIARFLRRSGLAFSWVGRAGMLAGRQPGLDGVDLVLTASESAAGPHRWVHALVRRAQSRGVAAVTLQHGLDNLHRIAAGVGFASDLMCCWPAAEAFPAGLAPEDRARLIPVGRPAFDIPVAEPAYDLAVFESLHARGYGDDQRALVLARLLGLALARPSLKLYVQAHPAGGWLDRVRDRLAAAGGITFVPSRQVRRAEAPGRDAVALAARVITTPSTIALDAVQAGRPVALALAGGAPFDGLPVLDSLAEWIAFADGPAAAGPDQAKFLAQNVVNGDANARILSELAAIFGKSRAHARVSQ